MKLSGANTNLSRASVLIIVLWVAFGLIAMTLYFAHAMSMELKAADNQTASIEADQAIEGAALYVSNVLANRPNPLGLPDTNNFQAGGVKVGDATFWIIGRDTNAQATSMQGVGDYPVWGLVDEASKVNLNNATAAMLQNLPGMDEYTSAATYDWQSTSTTASTDGAKSDTYSALPTPYVCKNAPYETPEELLMVYGMNMDLLYGEDANLNGFLDPNENDGATLPPMDNQDGILNPGLLEYVTTFTHESAMATNGSPRVVITNTPALTQLLESNNLSQYVPRTPQTSVLGYYASVSTLGMSATSFQSIEPFLMNPTNVGLINVTTAGLQVLGCLPGIGSNMAPQVLAYRQSNPPQVPSITWLVSALGGNQATIAQVGPYVTAYSYQYTADVVAVGHHNRGYRRVRFVFDCSSGTPLIAYREDLTDLGWALGKKLHDQLLTENSK
jgi:DNA uptake protein ComE-like DNA-binding protein